MVEDARHLVDRLDLEQPPAGRSGDQPHAVAEVRVFHRRRPEADRSHGDDVDGDAEAFAEVDRPGRVGAAVRVVAVRDDDQGPPAGRFAVLEEREQDRVVQGGVALREEPFQAAGQQRLAAGERLHEAQGGIEVDQERLVAPGQRAVEERRRDRVGLLPDGLHAAGGVDCKTQREGHVVRDVEVLHLAPLAVLADFEVLGPETGDRVSAAVDDQNLELDELDVDLAAELGALEQFDVLEFAAVAEPRHDPDEVLGRDAGRWHVGDHVAHAARSRLPFEVLEDRDELFRAVELDPFEGLGAGDGDAGFDPHCLLASAADRADSRQPYRERRIEPVQDDPVAARVGAPGSVRLDFDRVFARRVGEFDPGLEGWPGRAVRLLAVEQKLDDGDLRVDRQRLDQHAAAQEFPVALLGRQDADGRRPGAASGVGSFGPSVRSASDRRQVVRPVEAVVWLWAGVGRARRVHRRRRRGGVARALVDRAEGEVCEASALQVGHEHEVIAFQVEGLDPLTAQGRGLHLERVADEAGSAAAAEAVRDVSSVEEEDPVFALRVADEELRVVDADQEDVQPFREFARHLPHRRRAVLIAALAAAASAARASLAAAEPSLAAAAAGSPLAEAAGAAAAGRSALGASGAPAEGLAVGLLELLDRVLAQPFVANPDAGDRDDRIDRDRGRGLFPVGGFLGACRVSGGQEESAAEDAGDQRCRSNAVRAPPSAPVVGVPGHVEVKTQTRLMQDTGQRTQSFSRPAVRVHPARRTPLQASGSPVR